MKNKIVANIFLTLGIILVCVAIILSVIATNEKNIIGGADFHTFVFVFFREHSGVHFLLALLGVASIVASVITRILKRNKDGKESI